MINTLYPCIEKYGNYTQKDEECIDLLITPRMITYSKHNNIGY